MNLNDLRKILLIKKSMLAMHKNDSVCLESVAGRKQAQTLFDSVSVRISQIEKDIKEAEKLL